MIRAAVIGLGDIAKIHIPILQQLEGVVLAAVCDSDPAKAGEVPGALFFEDYRELLGSGEVDCVHICLPHHLHVPVAASAMERGIHVFLEKPMGLDLAQSRQLAEAAKAARESRKAKVCLCLQNRLNDTSVRLKELVDSGAYGKVQSIKGIVAWHRPEAYYTSKPWRGRWAEAGGGVMINQSIHTLDLMQWIGGKVKDLKGSTCQLLDYGIEVEDTASAQMTFENGATGLFYATNANGENASVELEVVMEKGWAAIKDHTLQLWENGEKICLVEDEMLEGTKSYYGASHRRLIGDFYKAIKDDTDGYIAAWEGLAAMALIEAVHSSSETGKRRRMEEYHDR